MTAALDAARRDRTTIVIAHRLWTVHHADQIIVLDDGRMVEEGATDTGGSAHACLVRQNGLYNRLYGLQFTTETSSQPDQGDE